jgi:hypothetical protein
MIIQYQPRYLHLTKINGRVGKSETVTTGRGMKRARLHQARTAAAACCVAYRANEGKRSKEKAGEKPAFGSVKPPLNRDRDRDQQALRGKGRRRMVPGARGFCGPDHTPGLCRLPVAQVCRPDPVCVIVSPLDLENECLLYPIGLNLRLSTSHSGVILVVHVM